MVADALCRRGGRPLCARAATGILRVPNIMNRVLRWHDFGSGREASRSEYCEYSQGSRQSHGPKSAPPREGCSHNGRRAAASSRGPACGDATAQARMCPAYDGAPMSRFGVASNDEAVGTCSALRGTLCRAACSYSRYELRHPSRDQSVLAATHTWFIMLGTLSPRPPRS